MKHRMANMNASAFRLETISMWAALVVKQVTKAPNAVPLSCRALSIMNWNIQQELHVVFIYYQAREYDWLSLLWL